MKVFMVEIGFENGQWLPMYQPCYDREEAEKKAVLKRKGTKYLVRVREYRRVEEGE